MENNSELMLEEDVLSRIKMSMMDLTHSICCTDGRCPRECCLPWKTALRTLTTCKCSLQTVRQLLANSDACALCKTAIKIPVMHAIKCRKETCNLYMCWLLKKHVLPIKSLKLFLIRQHRLPIRSPVANPASRNDDSMGQRGVNSQGQNSFQNASLSRSENEPSVQVRVTEDSPASPNDSPQYNPYFPNQSPPCIPLGPPEIHHEDRTRVEINVDRSPDYVPVPFSSDSPQYNPSPSDSLQYNALGLPKSPDYNLASPEYNPVSLEDNLTSPEDNPIPLEYNSLGFPRSPEYFTTSSGYNSLGHPRSPESNPSSSSDSPQHKDGPDARFSSSD